MLVVVSPAKRLDWSERDVAQTQPQFLAEANILAGHARQLSTARLAALMSLSDDLAKLNRARFAAFAREPEARTTRPAALSFDGDTYKGLRAEGLTDDEMAYAQRHLRILSGLYGVLRPRDAIQPYRLEMGSRLKSRRGETLYEFWGPTIAEALNAAAAEVGTGWLVNCASQEYFGAVDTNALTLDVVTPRFEEVTDGRARVVSFHAKRARGMLARFIVVNRVAEPEALRAFDDAGYGYVEEFSTPLAPVFRRVG